MKHQASVNDEGKREGGTHGWVGLCEVPRVGKFKETESRIVITRGCGEEGRESYCLSVKCFVEEEKVLHIDGCDFYTL